MFTYISFYSHLCKDKYVIFNKPFKDKIEKFLINLTFQIFIRIIFENTFFMDMFRNFLITKRISNLIASLLVFHCLLFVINTLEKNYIFLPG